jgi:hypothetical protein
MQTLPLPVQQTLPLHLRYGVVRFQGTLRHHSAECLVFQSDDARMVMDKLEWWCDLDEDTHGYMIVSRDFLPQ